MKIAFISGMSGYPWGGSEILWSQSAHRLLASGNTLLVSVTAFKESRPQLEALGNAGATVSERNWISSPRSERILRRILRRPIEHPGLSPCWQEIVNFRPDLVCISHGGCLCGLEWMLKCRNAKIPYVSLSQANAEQWWPSDTKWNDARTAYQGARRSFFVSSANRHLLEQQLALTLENAEVVRNPFNVDWNPSVLWPAEVNKYKLACVARLEPGAKGQDLLLQTLALEKWRNRPLSVTLVGSGPSQQSLRALASHLKISDQVNFRGQVHDIEAIWSSHHALLLPSRYEGLPLSLVEATLCARPPIVTDVAGNTELVDDNVTGFVAAAPTIAFLDEAMERAWNRRHEWQAIGNLAAARTRQLIPPDPAQVFADRLLDLAGG